MIRSISSMSATMPARVASSRALISTPRRSRASGVRRSCETPASSSARSCSSWRRLAAIRLTPRLSVAISDGPCSGSGGGVSPRPDALDGRGELAQRTREIAREDERGGQQHGGEHQAPQRRARRMILGLRARRHRKADPIAGARRPRRGREGGRGRARSGARCPRPVASRSRACERLEAPAEPARR